MKKNNSINNENTTICFICLNEIQLNDKMVISNTYHTKNNIYYKFSCSCKFVLHRDCLFYWTDKSPTCPICLLPIYETRFSIMLRNTGAKFKKRCVTCIDNLKLSFFILFGVLFYCLPIFCVGKLFMHLFSAEFK
jgi:hypothetical protein